MQVTSRETRAIDLRRRIARAACLCSNRWIPSIVKLAGYLKWVNVRLHKHSNNLLDEYNQKHETASNLVRRFG
jgi:hypothetical protein